MGHYYFVDRGSQAIVCSRRLNGEQWTLYILQIRESSAWRCEKMDTSQSQRPGGDGKQRPPLTLHRNIEESMVPKPKGTVHICIREHSKRSCTNVKSNCNTSLAGIVWQDIRTRACFYLPCRFHSDRWTGNLHDVAIMNCRGGQYREWLFPYMACIYVLVVILYWCFWQCWSPFGWLAGGGALARQILELEYFTAKGTTQQDLKWLKDIERLRFMSNSSMLLSTAPVNCSRGFQNSCRIYAPWWKRMRRRGLGSKKWMKHAAQRIECVWNDGARSLTRVLQYPGSCEELYIRAHQGHSINLVQECETL